MSELRSNILDLSQVTGLPTEYSVAESTTKTDPLVVLAQVKQALIDLFEQHKKITTASFQQQEERFQTQIDGLTQNINAVLNDLDRRLEAAVSNHYELADVLYSFVILNLDPKSMDTVTRDQHLARIEEFLKQNADLVVKASDDVSSNA